MNYSYFEELRRLRDVINAENIARLKRAGFLQRQNEALVAALDQLVTLLLERGTLPADDLEPIQAAVREILRKEDPAAALDAIDMEEDGEPPIGDDPPSPELQELSDVARDAVHVYCLGCGYDLHGIDKTCPNCSRDFDRDDPSTFSFEKPKP